MLQPALKRLPAVLMAAAMAAAVPAVLAGAAEEGPLPGTVQRFEIARTAMHLERTAAPGTYFDKAGRRFAILGFESGTFEAWAWPLKLFRNFELSFLTGTSTTPIRGRDIVRSVDVEPEATTLTFVWQTFTIRAHYVTDIDEAGAIILLDVDSSEPLTIICGFLPVLQPMWPAGLGGQYAAWDDGLKAYLISEPTRRNHALVGSPAARGISYTPAHMLSDFPNEFKIEAADPAGLRGRFIPIVMSGGKGDRETVKALYRRLAGDPEGCYRRARGHYAGLLADSLDIDTPDERIDLAFQWAKTALDALLVDNPDLGRGLVAGLGPSGSGGRPGFGWFFGGDACLNSFALNDLGMFRTAREALEFTAKWQRRDGKMAHELSQAAGYIDWWKDYPYGYIHGDTTPYYLAAVGDYYRRTGDMGFLRSAWPSLVKAYGWCLTTDADGDGLMDNSRAGLGALEFGSLTGIRTDVYLAAVWTRAAGAMKDLAGAMGDTRLAGQAEAAFRKAAAAWNERFWDGEAGRYSFAFGANGGLVGELTPWSAVGLAWGLGDRDRTADTLSAICSPELMTDWGVRMLSEKSPLYEPLNYNYGACWPFISGWTATALLKAGFPGQGTALLKAGVEHAFDNSPGTVTELFSGARNIWPGEAVPHQGFSTTGTVMAVVRGLLGLEADVPGREVRISPAVPPDWRTFTVRNWKVGASVLDLIYEKESGLLRFKIRSKGGGPTGLSAILAPLLSPGSRVISASLNGRGVPFKDLPTPGRSTLAELGFELNGDDVAEIRFSPGLEIIPPVQNYRTGEASRGIRILRTDVRGDLVTIRAAGPAGKSIGMNVVEVSNIGSVEGASLDREGRRIVIGFPEGGPGEYTVREFTARLKR